MNSKRIIIGMLSFFFFDIVGRICTSCYIVLSFFLTFYIVRKLRVCYSLYVNTKVILTQEKPDHLQKELAIWCVFIIVHHLYYPFFIRLLAGFNLVEKAYLNLSHRNSQIFMITLFIWIGIFSLKKLTKFEISYLSGANNLNFGYGASISYYLNYLKKILPESFCERVKQYEMIEGVKLPHKLYILFPKSCKVKKHIDKSDFIESAKNLPAIEIDHGGVARRKYCSSVYLIKFNGDFRCALEYAQPLKTLRKWYDDEKISLTQMYIERESFKKYLMLWLNDHKNSFEACELVEIDDEREELDEILSSLSSVQLFKKFN